MRRLPALSVMPVFAAALALAGCGKAGAQAAAPAANASAPVKWDFASKDPARNPEEANKESAVSGYIP